MSLLWFGNPDCIHRPPTSTGAKEKHLPSSTAAVQFNAANFWCSFSCLFQIFMEITYTHIYWFTHISHCFLLLYYVYMEILFALSLKSFNILFVPFSFLPFLSFVTFLPLSPFLLSLPLLSHICSNPPLSSQPSPVPLFSFSFLLVLGPNSLPTDTS